MGFWAAAAVAAPGFAQAQPADLFYERAMMSAADARCGLFEPQVGAALAASAAQARGAALRGGASSDDLRTVERSARAKAARAGCASPDITTAASRVKAAFSGYAKITRLTYPGDIAPWHADRSGGRLSAWRLSQDATFGRDRMAFGLAGRDGPGVLLAVGRFADGAQPYSARLLLRDGQRSSGPYLDRWAGGSTARLPLERRLPPRSGLKVYVSAARSPAAKDLLPKKAKWGWAFRFPDAAALELAGLDPREAVAVEFLFPNDMTRRAYVEVGDFAAGRAFLQVASR
jgi:hypothetical protein